MRLRHTSELAAMITGTPSPADTPVLAAAQRRHLTGVVAVSATVPPEEQAQTARLCSVRGSTWIAVIAGDVPDAHWRWRAHRDGTLDVPLLNRTVVATL
jgi:hypothetical protein